MKFRVVTVGKPKDPALAEAIASYERRASRYWPLEFATVREERGVQALAPTVRAREGERLLAQAAAPVLIACDEGGRAFTSAAFANFLQRLREDGRDVDLAIGGANGLSEDVLQRARYRLSLAPWTLPHDLARLVLAEQLYRAGSILRGEPYHRA